ncbi:FliM/FliN family flagellar motor switch protein [Enterobacter sp.]|uniref:FliM/FliN family flagellar motor switch protein n=1 Tax=Enterobacter sp. TaxID=42895 RepID=UPI00296EC131|nr:FliM/FliN family flagellar motor switch protein [Enterobacter sp.]
MNNHEDLLEEGFELASHDEAALQPVAPPVKTAAKGAPLTDSMALLKRIPVTLTLEVSSVEVMLADLLSIDDDTVIELNKLAGEPLDIKVNNILLGKAEVVVVNEKYGLRVIEFNTRDINDLTP